LNLPKRMPVLSSKDRIRVHWLVWMCTADLLAGLAIMFGPTRGVAQTLLRQVITIPTPVWGAFLFASAVLTWAGWYLLGSGLAASGWAFHGGAALMSIINGTAPSWLGPIMYGYIAGNHVLVIIEVKSGMDQDRERRQRRG
jgi:hypothetical protein